MSEFIRSQGLGSQALLSGAAAAVALLGVISSGAGLYSATKAVECCVSPESIETQRSHKMTEIIMLSIFCVLFVAFLTSTGVLAHKYHSL